jgi:hypothetical protein
MFSSDKQIADFKACMISKNNYGLDIEIFENEDKTIKVNSEGLLENQYGTFESFLDDLALKNPNWHTYYFVRIKEKYQNLVQIKLKEHVEKILYMLKESERFTFDNWSFEKEKNIVQKTIASTLNERFNFYLKIEQEEPIEHIPELTEIWNGYCPECLLKGKKVTMKLNRNDFFECEESKLQIVRFPGVLAVILNFRGTGNFRSSSTYGHEVENGEYFAPQNSKFPPFNNPTVIFEEMEEMKLYIKTIK